MWSDDDMRKVQPRSYGEPPPPPGEPLPIPTYRWKELRPIHRVINTGCNPKMMSAGPTPGRFRPIVARSGDLVGTLYGSNRLDAALAETVFREAPHDRGPWTVNRSSLLGRLRTMLVPLRDLTLADLTGWGHASLRLEGHVLTECDASAYPATTPWGQWFHDLPLKLDGLYWRSRRYDGGHVLMLFGDRVKQHELHVVIDETIALWEGVGLDDVLAVARAAKIVIE